MLHKYDDKYMDMTADEVRNEVLKNSATIKQELIRKMDASCSIEEVEQLLAFLYHVYKIEKEENIKLN